MPQGRITLDGSLKSGAAALADQPGLRAVWERTLAGRRVWLAASTHPGEEAVAAAALALLRRSDPAACLIVAPRDPARAFEVLAAMRSLGFDAAMTETPAADHAVYVVPRIGQMGLWYRLADAALVGGSLVPVGGHNPYEPARLDCAVLHGPEVANFAADYAALHSVGGARLVRDADDLATALADPALVDMRGPAARVAGSGRAALERVAERLLHLGAERLDRRD